MLFRQFPPGMNDVVLALKRRRLVRLGAKRIHTPAEKTVSLKIKKVLSYGQC